MSRDDNAEETDSGRPIQYSTSDIIIVFTPSPTPCSRSSLSDVHGSMGSDHDDFILLQQNKKRRVTGGKNVTLDL